MRFQATRGNLRVDDERSEGEHHARQARGVFDELRNVYESCETTPMNSTYLLAPEECVENKSCIRHLVPREGVGLLHTP